MNVFLILIYSIAVNHNIADRAWQVIYFLFTLLPFAPAAQINFN